MRLLFILSFTLAAFLAAVWFVPPRLAIAPDKAVLSAYIDGDIEVGSLALHLLPQPELRLRQVSYRADDMTATLDEVRYGLSWSQLWQVENRWRLTRIEAYDGAIEIASTPNQPIEATLKDIRKTLLALPIPSLRLHNVDIVLEAKKAPTQETLILPSLHADILRRAGDNYRFTFTLGDFTAAGEIKEASAARTAMVLSISAGDDSEELTLAGALQQEPHFQIDAEARFLSRRLLRNVLRNTNITLASDVDDALRLSGVITLTTDYIRAENLQTSLFGEELQTQLNITFDDTNTPTLRIRAASDAIDFSALSSTASRQAIFSTSPVAPPSFLYTLYATLFGTDKSLAGAFHLVSNQFVLGGERGRNLIVGLDMQDDNFHLTRLSADLPFSSSAVMVGDIATTNFDGRFSLRSSDTASLLSWLAVLFDGDAISLAGHISKIFPQGSGLQRIGVVSDITWAQSEGVRLRDVKGQLGDTAFTSNINLDRLSPLHGQVLVNLQKVDLANWNALVDTRFRGQPKAWFRHLTIEPFLLSVLSGLPPLADIDMHFVVDDMAVGTEHIGASDIHIGFTPDAIEIKRVHFADYLDAETTLSGQLLVQSRHLYGALQLAIEADDAQALSSRLLPPVPFVSVDMGRYIKLNAIWRLPTPDEQDWTSGFIGTAILNKREAQQIALDYTLRSPSRDIDLTTADSTLTLRGDGTARDIADLFSLPPSYKRQKQRQGAFRITTTAQAAALSSVDAALTLADDRFAFMGSLRPSAGGARLEGMAQVQQTQAQSLLGVAYNGNAQIIATADMISFSNLSARLGTGQLSGEGSYSGSESPANFNATILLSDFDASPFLPAFSAKNKWSKAPLEWNVLSDIKANLEVRLERLLLAGFTFDEVAGNIKWSDGVLEAAPLAVSLWGGQAVFEVQAEGGSLTPSFNLRGEYDDINGGAFFTSLYEQAIMDAPLSGVFEIGGRGTTPHDMLTDLKGNINLTAKAGQLYGAASTPLAFARALAVIDIGDGIFSTRAADISFTPKNTATEFSGKFDGVLDIASRTLKAQFEMPTQTFLFTGDIVAPAIKIESKNPEEESNQ